MNCKVCNKEVSLENVSECSACGELVCENCVAATTGIVICKRCVDEVEAMPEEERKAIESEIFESLKYKVFKVGTKVKIIDAMDTSLIGKIGIVEEVISHAPYSCNLNIEGKEGSWSNAWLSSCLEKVIE